MLSRIKRLFRKGETPRASEGAGPRASGGPWEEFVNEDSLKFREAFLANLAACPWEPHPRSSVFTQYDRSFYLSQREAFTRKYKCFWAVSKTIAPRRIVELGCASGSSADAYLSATPTAEYVGFDWFGSPWWLAAHDEETGERWQPRATLEALFRERGFTRWEVVDADLRSFTELPRRADLVVVDAAHDFENEYADLRLALTADPEYIFVDDSDDEAQARPAIEKFLSEDVAGRVEFLCPIDYTAGGLVIKLKKEPASGGRGVTPR